MSKGGQDMSKINIAAAPDLLNEGMTIREYAAIKLCVPESGADWLDEMIRKSQRDKFAGMALQGLIPIIGIPEDGHDDLWDGSTAERAYALADAMLKAREVQS